MLRMLKLVNGDDIIAEAYQSTNAIHQWEVENPVKVLFGPQGLVMIPLAAFIKETKFFIKSEHVIIAGDLSDDLRNHYNSKFGNGLVVPKLKLG